MKKSFVTAGTIMVLAAAMPAAAYAETGTEGTDTADITPGLETGTVAGIPYVDVDYDVIERIAAEQEANGAEDAGMTIDLSDLDNLTDEQREYLGLTAGGEGYAYSIAEATDSEAEEATPSEPSWFDGVKESGIFKRAAAVLLIAMIAACFYFI